MKSKKTKNSLVKVIAGVIIIGIFSISYIAFELYKKVFKANIKFGEDIEERYVFINSTDNFSDVVTLLSNYNLLLDTNSFRWVAEKKNYIVLINREIRPNIKQ